MADLENVHLRKGKSYPRPQGVKTWEEVKREKEERILQARKERASSTPMETTSTDAMDTEEAQEIRKEIAERAAKRELQKQKHIQYQKMKQTSYYKIPRAEPIPVPDLNRSKRNDRPSSVVLNYEVRQYEEIKGDKDRWQLDNDQLALHQG